MNFADRITAFTELGIFLKAVASNSKTNLNSKYYDVFEALQMQINRAQEQNGWFTKENVLFAIQSWGNSLSKDNIEKWTNNYVFPTKNESKTVAIVMAGNIPLVGFHDFLSVLISGHTVVVKLSSNDKYLLPIIAQFLKIFNTNFKDKITFTSENLTNFDAVIATGSDNTARYFEYYFKRHPHIIRKNRNSIAVLTGNESVEDLEALGLDIFQYFGLGCRSVSKLFVPRNYNFDLFFNAIFKFKDIVNYKKYENNYDYNKAVYLMSLFKLQENGFLMLKEDTNYASPIATIFYEYYDKKEDVYRILEKDREKIQCVVGSKFDKNFIEFGKTQEPNLWDYADDVDTIDFLIRL